MDNNFRNNVFKENELQKDSVVAKNATTAADGKTYERAEIQYSFSGNLKKYLEGSFSARKGIFYPKRF